VRVHVVSDVHARTDALARSGDGADALICLGDLVLFLDYEDFRQGIFPTLFGAERTRTFVELRTAGRFDDARSLASGWWDEVIRTEGRERHTHVQELVDAQCRMPRPCRRRLPTYGNVDLRRCGPGTCGGPRRARRQVADIGGLRFGFVGGAPQPDAYAVRPTRDFHSQVEALGRSTCSARIPRRCPGLCYDVVARRRGGETGRSSSTCGTQPRVVLFGHVHQPLVPRTRVGRTEVVNVGHFRGTGTPYVLQW
jgi:predicted phosphodiesterase